jgi:hypothetical protein
LLDHDVAVAHDVEVMNSAPGHFPLDLALPIDDGQLAVALHGQTMLRRGDAGRKGDRQRKGKGTGCTEAGHRGFSGAKDAGVALFATSFSWWSADTSKVFLAGFSRASRPVCLRPKSGLSRLIKQQGDGCASAS